jgi:polyhydroxyalkanoate synthesis regulator phasin
VLDALKNYLSLATGLTEVTRQRATAAAKALVASGEARAESVTTLAEDLIAASNRNREAVNALVKFEVERTLGRLGFAGVDQMEAAQARIVALEGRVRALEAQLEQEGA